MEPQKLVVWVDVSPFPRGYFQVPAVCFQGISPPERPINYASWRQEIYASAIWKFDALLANIKCPNEVSASLDVEKTKNRGGGT